MENIDGKVVFDSDEINFMLRKKRKSFEVKNENGSLVVFLKRPKLIRKYIRYMENKNISKDFEIKNGKLSLSYEEFRDYLNYLRR